MDIVNTYSSGAAAGASVASVASVASAAGASGAAAGAAAAAGAGAGAGAGAAAGAADFDANDGTNSLLVNFSFSLRAGGGFGLVYRGQPMVPSGWGNSHWSQPFFDRTFSFSKSTSNTSESFNVVTSVVGSAHRLSTTTARGECESTGQRSGTASSPSNARERDQQGHGHIAINIHATTQEFVLHQVLGRKVILSAAVSTPDDVSGKHYRRGDHTAYACLMTHAATCGVKGPVGTTDAGTMNMPLASRNGLTAGL